MPTTPSAYLSMAAGALACLLMLALASGAAAVGLRHAGDLSLLER